MAIYPYGRKVWSTDGVSLAGAGPTSVGPIDIHDVTDLWLAAFVANAPTGTTPSLTVQLDLLDQDGNIYPSVLALTALTAAGHQSGSCGLHTSNLVLPMECQVTWTLGGTTPAFTGVTLSLYGR